MTHTLHLEDKPIQTDLADLYAPLRLDIDHKTGRWKLDDEHILGSLRTVMLGLVRQRIFWERGTVICRSYDFRTGHASVNLYPWEDTDFEPPEGWAGPAPKTTGFFGGPTGADTGKKVLLECESCPLHHWKPRDPVTGRQQPPRCQEQFVVPMFIEHRREWRAAYASFQKSALKPAKEYMRVFRDAKEPLYTVVTRIKLAQNLGKDFRYSVPEFQRVTSTPKGLQPVMSLAFRTMRDRMQQPVTDPVPSRGFFG